MQASLQVRDAGVETSGGDWSSGGAAYPEANDNVKGP